MVVVVVLAVLSCWLPCPNHHHDIYLNTGRGLGVCHLTILHEIVSIQGMKTIASPVYLSHCNIALYAVVS